MRTWLIFSLVVMTGLGGVAQAADGDLVRPFESDKAFVPTGRLDELVLETLNANGAEPAYLCSDEVFVRRVYLDMLGTLPEADEIEQFLALEDPRKRERLVDALFGREAFADYWSLKWCDLLRVKAEFPINLWPNAVQAYHRWVRDAHQAEQPSVRSNLSREMLDRQRQQFPRAAGQLLPRAAGTASRRPSRQAVALTFMGSRMSRGGRKIAESGMIGFLLSGSAYQSHSRVEGTDHLLQVFSEQRGDRHRSVELPWFFRTARSGLRSLPTEDPRRGFR